MECVLRIARFSFIRSFILRRDSMLHLASSQTHVNGHMNRIRPSEDIFDMDDPKIKEVRPGWGHLLFCGPDAILAGHCSHALAIPARRGLQFFSIDVAR
jgi:hypothetical protein